MKWKNIFTLLLILVGFCCYAQIEKEESVFTVVQQKAQPPFNINKYILDNLRYPALAFKNDIRGKIVTRFVVEKDGSITNIEIIKGLELGNGLPEEAIRLIKAMPKWNPAIQQDGKAVRSVYILPIRFELE